MTGGGPIEVRLARLYERLGESYMRRGWALAWALFLIAGVCAAALAAPYTDASPAEVAGTLAVIEGGLVLMMLYGNYVRRRQQSLFEAWWRAGRPGSEAAAVWDALAPLPVMWTQIGWPTGVVTVGLPTAIYGAVALDLGAGETATVFAAVTAAGGYAALIGSFAVDLYVRPALRDAAARMPPEATPARVRTPLARRLFAALLMTSGSTGFLWRWGCRSAAGPSAISRSASPSRSA